MTGVLLAVSFSVAGAQAPVDIAFADWELDAGPGYGSAADV